MNESPFDLELSTRLYKKEDYGRKESGWKEDKKQTERRKRKRQRRSGVVALEKGKRHRESRHPSPGRRHPATLGELRSVRFSMAYSMV